MENLKNNKDITATQFFSVIYLCLLSGILMYISSPNQYLNGLNGVLRPLVFFGINVVFSIPVVLLIKKCDGQNVFNSLRERSVGVSRFIAFLYFVLYGFIILKLSVRFDVFASSEMFPAKRMIYLSAIIVIFCSLLAGVEIGGLARASVIFAVIVTASVVLMNVFLVKVIDFLNFTPLFENGVGEFFGKSFRSSVFAVECGTLPLFYGEIKGNIKRGYYTCLGAATLVFIIVMASVVGTLGLFADTQLFPSFATAMLAKIGLFERLDAVETAVWISCVMVKLTFFISVSARSLCFAFDRLKYKVACVFIGGTASVILLSLSSNIKNHKLFSMFSQNLTVFLLSITVLPLVSFLIIKFKGVKALEKQ